LVETTELVVIGTWSDRHLRKTGNSQIKSRRLQL